MATQKTAGKQRRGRPFGRGVSGNAAGRPRGSRNRATVMAEAVSEDDALAITGAVVAKARKGDMVAAKIVLDRLWPAARGRAVAIGLPDANSPQGVTGALAAIIAAMGAGAISADEASAMCAVLETQRRAIETEELERRLLAIEEQLKTNAQTD